MFSSADLIEALRRRARTSLRPEREPGHFPPGWQAWFQAMRERIGAITGASADAIIAIFLQRELIAPPRRVGALNRWQAFATLWRQQWQPPGREERRERIAAYAITLVIHLFLLLILLWLASIRIVGTAAPPGEQQFQVEYIGIGTPEDTGAGAPGGQPQEQPTPAAAAPAQAQSAATPVAVAPPPATPPAPAQQAAEQPPLPAQPLQVTQVPVPDTKFVLSETNPQLARQQPIATATPQLQAPSQQVQVNATPSPVRIIQTPTLPQVPLTQPQLAQQPTEVTLQEAPKPLPGVQMRALPQQSARIPNQQLPGVATIPMPAAATTAPAAAASSHATAAASSPAPAGTAPQAGGPPAPSSGTQPSAAAAGSGRPNASKPGAWPTPQRGDDWGTSTRNRPGGNTGKQPGLFNADGSPRLSPGGQPEPGGGSPPGLVQQDIPNLDRAGTWLKHKPNTFEPTSLNKFWVPNETLLEEWVRKNIREVSIPIPGTTKKLRCVVSLLQLGGGCGISDPNMQDQEAIARPPPDIPFKPDLQEDQDALLRKPPPKDK